MAEKKIIEIFKISENAVLAGAQRCNGKSVRRKTNDSARHETALFTVLEARGRFHLPISEVFWTISGF